MGLWTTFPTAMIDPETGSTTFSLVHYDYTTNYASMPKPASWFYRVLPQTSTIQSEEYQLSNVGSHTLKIKIADELGGEKSFTITVTVTPDPPAQTY